MTSKISIAVGGRFHSDQMARAFLRSGRDVTLYSSYPASRFASDIRSSISSFLPAEISYRTLKKLKLERVGEQAKMKLFGNFLVREISDDNPDHTLIVWSSFAVEVFKKNPRSRKILIRDSTHILNQMDLLIGEYERFGIRYRPDPLCVERELMEYELADEIWVLSKTAKQSFLKFGISGKKIRVLPLGVNANLFSPRSDITRKKPVQVVYFGTVSFRKGAYYLLKAFQKINPSLARLTLIGPIEDLFAPLLKEFPNINVLGPMTHEELSKKLLEYDLYCLPSLEEGFPNTVVQAMACGLVPITCNNHGVSDYLSRLGDQFFVLPRSTDSLVERIQTLAELRNLEFLKKECLDLASQLTWENYSKEVLKAFLEPLSTKPRSVSDPILEASL